MKTEYLERGLDFESYLEKADMNVPTMKANFADTKIRSEDDAYFGSLAEKLPREAISIACFSESWCGDCVENLPIVAKMASTYPIFRLYVFPRDLNLDIMDEYFGEGFRTIPVFIFYDPNGEEIGRFIERPKGAHAFMDQAKEQLAGLPPEERKRGMYRARTKLRKLYKDGLRDETVSEIRRLVEKRYGP
jgi:thiol-disulfide isomerase/thioredoxin